MLAGPTTGAVAQQAQTSNHDIAQPKLTHGYATYTSMGKTGQAQVINPPFCREEIERDERADSSAGEGENNKGYWGESWNGDEKNKRLIIFLKTQQIFSRIDQERKRKDINYWHKERTLLRMYHK